MQTPQTRKAARQLACDWLFEQMQQVGQDRFCRGGANGSAYMVRHDGQSGKKKLFMNGWAKPLSECTNVFRLCHEGKQTWGERGTFLGIHIRVV